MPNVSLNDIAELRSRIPVGSSKKWQSFSLVKNVYPSKIGNAINAEIGIHVIASARIAVSLCSELEEFVSNYPNENIDDRNVDIVRSAIRLAYLSVDDYVQLLETNSLEEFVKIALVIIQKGARLAGFEALNFMIECLVAVKETGEMLTIQKAELVVMTKRIFEIEAFMTTVNLSVQHAIAQVYAITRPTTSSSFVASAMTSIGQHMMNNAREEVIEMIVKVRNEMLKEFEPDEIPFDLHVKFHSHGMWPD